MEENNDVKFFIYFKKNLYSFLSKKKKLII